MPQRPRDLCGYPGCQRRAVDDGRCDQHVRVTGPGAQPIVTIVGGPPASGKTTWVRQEAKRGDLIVDLDALYAALSGLPWYDKPDSLLPFALAARDAVIARLSEASDVHRAWIITTEASKRTLQSMKAEINAQAVVLLTVSTEECMRRIRADERRNHQAQLWQSLITEWWQCYESEAD